MRSYLRQLVYLFCLVLPQTRWYRFRAWLWRLAGVKVHPTARIVGCVKFIGTGVSVGRDTFVGHDTLISGPVVVGDKCDIAANCVLHSGTHELGGRDRRAGAGSNKVIHIGDGTWLGTGTTVLAGVTVGRGVVVAAGSVVTKDIPDHVLVAGIPAQIKRELN